MNKPTRRGTKRKRRNIQKNMAKMAGFYRIRSWGKGRKTSELGEFRVGVGIRKCREEPLLPATE